MMRKKIYFTPGPSQLHYSLDYHMKKALDEAVGSISHRSSTFQKIYQETEESLRHLFGLPEDYKILFLSSATDIWERMILNLVDHSSHHFVNGAFSKRFFDFALHLGKESTVTQAPEGDEFSDFDIPDRAELIALTQNETSTGYSFLKDNIRALRSAHPDKLLAVDSVSSIPAVPLEYDQVDMTYFSVQKCFGLPAGLGVWPLNDRTIEHYERLSSNSKVQGTYRLLGTMLKQAAKHQTPETPNVLLIYLLGKIAQEMLQKGIKSVINDTIYKSAILYQALEEHPGLSPFVRPSANRSKTVIVADCEAIQEGLVNHLDQKGLVVGKGYGSFKQQHIRIANFPAHSREQVEMLCDLISKYR